MFSKLTGRITVNSVKAPEAAMERFLLFGIYFSSLEFLYVVVNFFLAIGSSPKYMPVDWTSFWVKIEYPFLSIIRFLDSCLFCVLISIQRDMQAFCCMIGNQYSWGADSLFLRIMRAPSLVCLAYTVTFNENVVNFLTEPKWYYAFLVFEFQCICAILEFCEFSIWKTITICSMF